MASWPALRGGNVQYIDTVSDVILHKAMGDQPEGAPASAPDDGEDDMEKQWRGVTGNVTFAKAGDHPGFKAEQGSIAKKEGISPEHAGAILAAATRNASEKAKAANPQLERVEKSVEGTTDHKAAMRGIVMDHVRKHVQPAYHVARAIAQGDTPHEKIASTDHSYLTSYVDRHIKKSKNHLLRAAHEVHHALSSENPEMAAAITGHLRHI